MDSKYVPWLLGGLLALVAFNTFFNKPAAPVGPNPNFPYVCPDCVPQPVNPYAPPKPCPCPRCLEMESKFKSERVAMRRELLRTQLNVQQLQSRTNVQPMKLPEWFYYSETIIGDDGGRSMKFDSAPTPDPDKIEATSPAGK